LRKSKLNNCIMPTLIDRARLIDLIHSTYSVASLEDCMYPYCIMIELTVLIQAEMDLIAEVGSELDKIEDMNNQQFAPRVLF
jgi:hypothetical protein